MRQKIYPDDHGPDTWDPENTGRVYVHIVNSMMYREITGKKPPETPISAKSYTEHGMPWFDLYDEKKGDLKPGGKLVGVKSISEKDKEHGFANQQDDTPVEIPAGQVKTIGDPTLVHDGKW